MKIKTLVLKFISFLNLKRVISKIQDIYPLEYYKAINEISKWLLISCLGITSSCIYKMVKYHKVIDFINFCSCIIALWVAIAIYFAIVEKLAYNENKKKDENK